MKKQIMSIAAAAALFTTGAMAFDTDHNGRLLKQDGSSYIQGKYTTSPTLNIHANNDLKKGAPGQLGDALIYPAFFSENGWETEFTVINTGDEAMVAKVVLYSQEDSKELKDFNIYLSANDVFRATIKNNELIIKDSSFVFQKSTPTTTTNFGYTYTDTATDASVQNIAEGIPEGSGYIAVYGMIQADNAQSGDYLIPGTTKDITSYHQNHDKLWKDYRHLVDECRGEAWRGGIQDGIYNKASLNVPNILLDYAAGPTVCNNINSTLSKNQTSLTNIVFKSPDKQLTGSVTLKANDSRGTRSMHLNAIPLTNFTDDLVKQGMLWTEGEFANIADRNIIAAPAGSNALTATTKIAASNVVYDGAKTLADSRAFTSDVPYTYEYGSDTASAFVFTQPHKRTLIQLVQDRTAGTADAKCEGDSAVKMTDLPWEEYTRVNDSKNKCFVDNYGSFKVNATIFDDNENKKTADAGGFTFSPASVTSADDATAAGEVSMIANIVSDADRADGFTSGYVEMKTTTVPGIATHMKATMVDGNEETNWIYSGRQE